MPKNHFLPFQINTIILWFFYKMAAGGHFLMSKNHFRWHFWPFQINTKLFFKLFYKMAAGTHLRCPILILISVMAISNKYKKMFLKNGRRRPFCMSEIHFRSNFWPFQINTQHYFVCKFWTKSLPSAISDVLNSLSIAFLTILDHYGFIFWIVFTK